MKNLYSHLPELPGVYFMRGAQNALLYVGKAANLRRRVSSYFMRPHEARIQSLVSLIRKVEFRTTDTILEALVLEAALIKKFQPPYNIREKDDSSFLFVEITSERFPRVLLVRGKEKLQGIRFGPFVSASSIREALKVVRSVFPFSIHSTKDLTRVWSRPCFDAQVGLCPGTCVQAVSRRDYLYTVRNVALFFQGKKEKIVASLARKMERCSKEMHFEEAEKLKRQLGALRSLRDITFRTEALPSGLGSSMVYYAPFRIEGYDISTISGTSSVGVMVVFLGGAPVSSEYRKFRIRSVSGLNDVGMMAEVLRRRFRHSWRLPQLILVDGGRGQVNIARRVLRECSLDVPVLGLAKGPERKRNDLTGVIPSGVSLETLIRVRDEAHRFAIAYHRKRRDIDYKAH